ncbi:MarR family winged helix-turn-helix transcriptional regulator [Falsibacillus pallidus]|uniref:MarR family winged helix-turn-helix transcriptional regulator n=1 Tax=Falsibacillus pallidus TaxID=493781 RepID=UPI003D99604F
MMDAIAKEYIALIPNLFNSFSEINQIAVPLTHLQSHVVDFIYMQQRQVKLKEIRVELNIPKQQMTTVIKDLEEEGYLTKETDAEDKRAILVSLTSKGVEIQEQKWMQIYQKFTDDLTKLNGEELIDFHFSLHKINALLRKMGARDEK